MTVELTALYQFRRDELFRLAFTHKSVGTPNNERLEWLGDIVIGYHISLWLNEAYPSASEGELTLRRSMLVNRDTLERVACQFGFEQHIRWVNANNMEASQRMLGNVVESYVAAVEIDSAGSASSDIVRQLFADYFNETVGAPVENAKNRLQNHIQKKSLPPCRYQVINKEGPDHEPIFHVSCEVAGYRTTVASARRIGAAEDLAAEMMYQQMQ